MNEPSDKVTAHLPTPVVQPAPLPPTPLSWRISLAAGILVLGLAAFAVHTRLDPRAQSAVGTLCLLGLVFLFSANLRAVNWRTVGWGIALQLLLALFILRFQLPYVTSLGLPQDFRPGYELISAIAQVIQKFLEFSNKGAQMIFGKLADEAEMRRVLGDQNGFIFAFVGLPTIIFVSAFFTILYYFGILQFVVRISARGMMYLMRTSGAESLSAAANVFMGQTEAPLIVKPYVQRMTQSELLALMVGGMATISGGMMAVYIRMGADAVSLLATSVMAAPCGLYLAKIILPEMETPETLGKSKVADEQPYRNVIDAAAAGTSDGLHLALNVAAMLISFLALIALVDYLLGMVPGNQSLWATLIEARGGDLVIYLLQTLAAYAAFVLIIWSVIRHRVSFVPRLLMALPVLTIGYFVFLFVLDLLLRALPAQLSLGVIFAWVFSPLAFLIGVQGDDIFRLADLLGTKLAVNEFVAYIDLTGKYRGVMSTRAYDLATFALTGFANIGSLGILIGGVGAMAPSRRGDLASLAWRALFAGFMATVINAAIAGMLLPI